MVCAQARRRSLLLGRSLAPDGLEVPERGTSWVVLRAEEDGPPVRGLRSRAGAPHLIDLLRRLRAAEARLPAGRYGTSAPAQGSRGSLQRGAQERTTIATAKPRSPPRHRVPPSRASGRGQRGAAPRAEGLLRRSLEMRREALGVLLVRRLRLLDLFLLLLFAHGPRASARGCCLDRPYTQTALESTSAPTLLHAAERRGCYSRAHFADSRAGS